MNCTIIHQFYSHTNTYNSHVYHVMQKYPIGGIHFMYISVSLGNTDITSNPKSLSYKSKMEDLAVEVCGENGAYYKVCIN